MFMEYLVLRGLLVNKNLGSLNVKVLTTTHAKHNMYRANQH